MKNFENKTFVVLDVETTGLSPQGGDRIVEIAMLKVKGAKVIDKFASFINPGRPISYGAFLVNRITDDMLRDAPALEDVMKEVVQFMEGCFVVGHNVKFDLGFLNNELMLSGFPIIEDSFALDTVKMAKGLLPGLPSYSLSSVSYSLGVMDHPQHRAMSDVKVTYDVFTKLLKIVEKNQMDDWGILLNLFGIGRSNNGETRIKVKLIQDIIAMQGQVHFLYSSVTSGMARRIVTPKEVIGKGRQAMLVGFCHSRREQRTFQLEKILDLKKAEQC